MLIIKQVRVNERKAPVKDWSKRAAIYTRARKEYDSKPRIYFWPEGETINNNLINRRERPHTLYKLVLPQVLQQAGFPPDTKAKWSQYAGCTMCPCSPGFIVQDTSKRVDVHVTIV